MIVARSRSCEDASVKIQTAAKNIATGETSQVITSFDYYLILSSLDNFHHKTTFFTR